MSRLSIYETSWIDLVFENRNKNYGAYELRRESVKSSFTALFMGLLFIASIGTLGTVVSYLNPDIRPIEIPMPVWDEPIVITEVVLPEIKKPALPVVKSQMAEKTILKDQLINPVAAHSEEVVKEVAINLENRNTSSVISDGTGTIGLNPSPSTGTGTEITKAVDYGTSIVNTAILDKLPEFPGGMKKFYSYVGNNFEKPELDGMSNLKVYVSFVIEKDGSMSNIKVVRDPGYGLGEEAIRVLKSLKTKWAPGIIDSKPVRTAYNLPISIELR